MSAEKPGWTALVGWVFAGLVSCGRAGTGASVEHRDTGRFDAASGESTRAAAPLLSLDARRLLVRERATRTAGEELRSWLADGDPEVVSWAALGLGATCPATPDQDSTLVRALAIRAVTAPPGQGRLRPPYAIAGALARCGSDEAEATLGAWLGVGGDAARAATFGLAVRAAAKGGLSEAAERALLTAPSDADDLYAARLEPFAFESRLRPSLASALERAARSALATSGPSRTFAIRTLGLLRAPTEDLERILEDPAHYDGLERAQAARELEHLGPTARRGLERLAAELGIDPLERDPSPKEPFAVRLAVVRALAATSAGLSRAPLTRIAERPVPPRSSPVLRRHLSLLRCAAAAGLAGTREDDPHLSSCDPDGGEAGASALLQVLDRAPLIGARWTALQALLGSPRPLVRSKALALLGGHPEVTGAMPALVEALRSSNANVVCAAARLVASHPERAASLVRPGTAPGSSGPREAAEGDGRQAVRTAILEALSRSSEENRSPEATQALVEAAITLRLEALCGDASPIVRASAAAGLSAWARGRAGCTDAPRFASAPDPPLPARARIELATDAGEVGITFDAALAPGGSARFAALARGRCSGAVVRKVVPGYWVELGDGGESPRSDAPQRVPGWGAGPVEALDVLMPTWDRAARSCRLRVALSRDPPWDEGFELVGRADGAWAELVEGDLVLPNGRKP